jgi:uracil DNA glycosylase
MTLDQARLVQQAIKTVTTTRNVRVMLVGQDPLTGAQIQYEVHVLKGSVMRPTTTIVIKNADVWQVASSLKD